MINDIVIVIPAYNPDEKFINFVKSMYEFGYRQFIVVDDGSKEESQCYFDIAKNLYGCDIVKHNINLGQGRAFKSAFY